MAADGNQADRGGTSWTQMLAAEQIEKQARVCEANLERVRDKIMAMNGDMTDIATQLRELRAQVEGLTTNMIRQIADLTLEMHRQTTTLKAAFDVQVSEMKAQTSKLDQRWKIWPTLKEVLIVVLALVSMVISVMSILGTI